MLRAGITESHVSQFVASIEALRQRSALYGDLYSRLATLQLAPIASDTRDGVDDHLSHASGGTYEIFNTGQWTSYLASVDTEKSNVAVRDALEEAPPLENGLATWLGNVVKSELFLDAVWMPLIEEQGLDNVSSADLNQLIQSAARGWYELAASFNDGTASFKQMEMALICKQGPDMLRTAHWLIERRRELGSITENFERFLKISKIRHLIGPFVAALRSFTLVNNTAIEEIHSFVQKQLASCWDRLSLKELARIGIERTLYSELAVDKNRANVATMEFIASFVTTSDSTAPVIEWLRSKSEQDFEAMGKILQGTLYEAYGND